jgi:hypothetical protein
MNGTIRYRICYYAYLEVDDDDDDIDENTFYFCNVNRCFLIVRQCLTVKLH